MQTVTTDFSGDKLLGLAATIPGIDVASLGRCIQERQFEKQVQQERTQALKAGVQGTPTFVIGTLRDDTVIGEIVVGALPLGVFEQKLRQAALVNK